MVNIIITWNKGSHVNTPYRIVRALEKDGPLVMAAWKAKNYYIYTGRVIYN